MIKTKKLKDTFFPISVFLVLTDDWVEFNKKYKADKDNNTAAFVYEADNGIVVAFHEKFFKQKHITHEAIHVVNFIFKFLGVKLDIDNDEFQAYLTEYYYEQIDKELKILLNKE
jgi:hypothetical protein